MDRPGKECPSVGKSGTSLHTKPRWRKPPSFPDDHATADEPEVFLTSRVLPNFFLPYLPPSPDADNMTSTRSGRDATMYDNQVNSLAPRRCTNQTDAPCGSSRST